MTSVPQVSEPQGLTSHRKTHTASGEKPFKFDSCAKHFSLSNLLVRQLKTHIREANKQYECEECSKKLANSRSLKSHKRTHTGENWWKVGGGGWEVATDKYYGHLPPLI